MRDITTIPSCVRLAVKAITKSSSNSSREISHLQLTRNTLQCASVVSPFGHVASVNHLLSRLLCRTEAGILMRAEINVQPWRMAIVQRRQCDAAVPRSVYQRARSTHTTRTVTCRRRPSNPSFDRDCRSATYVVHQTERPVVVQLIRRLLLLLLLLGIPLANPTLISVVESASCSGLKSWNTDRSQRSISAI